MKLKKFLNIGSKESGFALMEVLLGSSILIGVGLAAAYLFNDQRKAQKRFEHSESLSVFHEALNQSMQVDTTCTATLNNQYFLASNFNTPGTLNRITTYDVGQFIRPDQVWLLAGINLQQGVSQTGKLKIKVTYQMNPKIPGAISITKDIVVGVKFNSANRFQKCFSTENSSITLKREFCKTMNKGGIDSTGNPAAVWSEDLEECKFNTQTKACSTNKLVIDEISADGVVHCGTITKLKDNGNMPVPDNLLPAGSMPCGEAYISIFQNTNKVFKIKCQGTPYP